MAGSSPAMTKVKDDAGNILFVSRWPHVTVRPAAFPCQRDRGLGADLVAGGGAEFERLQPTAEQIDVVDGLGALVAAIDDAGGKQVGAHTGADRDIFRA